MNDSIQLCSSCREVTAHTDIEYYYTFGEWNVYTGNCFSCGVNNVITIKKGDNNKQCEEKRKGIKFSSFHETLCAGVLNWRELFPINSAVLCTCKEYKIKSGDALILCKKCGGVRKNMNRIEEIKERWRKATPGPWLNRGNFVATSETAHYGYPRINGVICGLEDGEYVKNENCENDVEAIAKAPEDVSYLLSKLEIAEKALNSISNGYEAYMHNRNTDDQAFVMEFGFEATEALKQIRE